MTITYHAKIKMEERLIPEKVINKAIKQGKKFIKNNRLLYNYGIYIIVVDIENTTIITVHYISKVTDSIRDIAEKFNISFTDAVQDYLKYVI